MRENEHIEGVYSFLLCLSYSIGRTSLVVAFRYLGMKVLGLHSCGVLISLCEGFLIKNKKGIGTLEDESVWFTMSTSRLTVSFLIRDSSQDETVE